MRSGSDRGTQRQVTSGDALASVVLAGYWVTRGDYGIGKRVDGEVLVVAYPFGKGRQETTYKQADVMEAVSQFVAGAGAR